MRHVERGPQLGEPLLNLFGSLAIAFGGGRDAERAQQFGRGPAGIPRFAEDRMKPLAGEVMKYQVDDTPGIECLFVEGLVVGVHEPTQRRPA
jgi:hypothetical protein